MRTTKTITQIFDRCAVARVKASLVLCIAALIFSPLSAHAETAALQYDNNGNITQRTTPLGTTTYTYDPLGRLTSEAGPAKTQTFTYDENGNRLSDGAGSYTYEPVSNRMSTRLGLAVTFDAAGRLTADGTGRTFAYNQAGQLYQVRQGGTLIATYYYDGNGLRSRKVTTASAPQGAQTVIYGYDEQGHLIAELSGTDAPIRSYFWQNDIPLAQMEHQAGDKILYFVTDHLNTPRAAMDETGKVVWRWESDAFGSTAPNEDADGDGNKVTVNLRFPGQYYDVESGLHYNGHRYYSPLLRIFTQTDRLDLLRQAVNPLYAGYSEPTDLQRALNQPFTYTGNNPMSYVDPLGLSETEYGPLTEALRDFVRNYSDMRDANTIGADKYFHCMANCQAAKRGPVGEAVSEIISELREQSDEHLKGDLGAACDADRAANKQGRNGKNSPDTPCSSTCRSLRPNGLNRKY